MKKLAFAIALMLLLSACSHNSREKGYAQYQFYYVTDSGEVDSVMDSETRTISNSSALSIINTYLSGPEFGELVSPFPPGTRAMEYSFVDSVAQVIMSGEFFTLTGREKTLAEACLTATISHMENASEVVITDGNGVTLRRSTEMYLLSEDRQAAADDTITLYFGDVNGQYLVAENRSIVSGAGESDERYIIDQLIKGPIDKDLTPVIPKGAELISISTLNRVCTVDFTGLFMENQPKTEREEMVSIYAIVNSLTSIESIDSVQITVEGGKPDIYRYMELSRPIEPFMGIVGPVRTNLNEIAVTLYVQSWSPDYLAGLPDIVKRKVNITTEEQLLEMLLEFQPPEGFSNPIPAGTEINSVSVSEGQCVVDLSYDFISGNKGGAASQRLSVLSIVATMTQLEYVDSVLLRIDSEAVSLPEYDLTEPISITGDVFFP